LMIIIRPLVLADSQPLSRKAGQTVRQVPQRTHRLKALSPWFMVCISFYRIMFIRHKKISIESD